tara:strand:- start:8 stop:391 length:384 start_codon:yes stop_codon:yes gene_type:complete
MEQVASINQFKMTDNEVKIIEKVSNFFNVTSEEVLTGGRGKKIVEARQWLMLLFRFEFRLGYVEIGKLVNRDHATCIHAVRKLTTFINIYPQDERIYEKLVIEIADLLPEVSTERKGHLCSECGTFS